MTMSVVTREKQIKQLSSQLTEKMNGNMHTSCFISLIQLNQSCNSSDYCCHQLWLQLFLQSLMCKYFTVGI